MTIDLASPSIDAIGKTGTLDSASSALIMP
jgi:hypothetical protein